MYCRIINIITDLNINYMHIKGMAFTLKERQILGIHGLLPPVVFSQQEQMDRVVANFRHWDNDLDRYIYLAALLDRNEKLFYQVVSANIDEMAPIIYTPTVGQACQKYGFIFRKPRLELPFFLNKRTFKSDFFVQWLY